MVDVTSLPISSAIDETIRLLDDLNRPQRQFQTRLRDDFRALVAEVPVVERSDDETVPPPLRRERGQGSSRVASDPPSFVALPRIRGGSGPFGPAVRQKLEAEVRAKRGW